ncbi:MAG: N-formylglutamate amidohydrolase [Gemmatimonadota bacterium]
MSGTPAAARTTSGSRKKSAPAGRSPGCRLLLTCEHGGNRVPARYARLFGGTKALLASHRGWDPGALPIARVLATGLDAPLRFVLTTRLLVDPNRSLASPELFSEFTRSLPEEERSRIIRLYYHRHRAEVERMLCMEPAGDEPIVHIGIHTFTPVWKGKKREVDVGVLFDPERSREHRFSRRWIEEVRRELPNLVVRSNEPYRGSDDGLTTELRQRIPPSRYLGIELEVSQRLAAGSPDVRGKIRQGLLASLRRALRETDFP